MGICIYESMNIIWMYWNSTPSTNMFCMYTIVSHSFDKIMGREREIYKKREITMQTAKPVNLWPLVLNVKASTLPQWLSIGPWSLSISLQKMVKSSGYLHVDFHMFHPWDCLLLAKTSTSLKLHLKHTLVDASTSNMLQPRAGENVQGPEKSGDCLVVV